MYSHVLHSISFANSFLNGPPAARVGCTMEAVLEGTPARSTGTCIEKTKHNKQPHGRKSLSRSNVTLSRSMHAKEILFLLLLVEMCLTFQGGRAMKTKQCAKDLATSCHLSNLRCAFSLASNLIEFFDKQVHGLMSGLGAAFRVEGIRQVSTYRAKRHKCRSFSHPPSVASRD